MVLYCYLVPAVENMTDAIGLIGARITHCRPAYVKQ